MSDNRMKKDIVMANGTHYSEQQRKADEAEINKLIGEIDEIKKHHRNGIYRVDIAIFIMLAFNAFAVALLMGLLR